MSFQVYSFHDQKTVAPGANTSLICFIQQLARSLSIRSIFWDIEIRDDAAPYNKLSLEDPLSFVSLQIGSGTPGNQISQSMTGFIGGLPLKNGTTFYMTKPGQIVFNSFFVAEKLQLRYLFVNYDTIKTYDYSISVVVEAEIIS